MTVDARLGSRRRLALRRARGRRRADGRRHAQGRRARLPRRRRGPDHARRRRSTPSPRARSRPSRARPRCRSRTPATRSTPVAGTVKVKGARGTRNLTVAGVKILPGKTINFPLGTKLAKGSRPAKVTLSPARQEGALARPRSSRSSDDAHRIGRLRSSFGWCGAERPGHGSGSWKGRNEAANDHRRNGGRRRWPRPPAALAQTPTRSRVAPTIGGTVPSFLELIITQPTSGSDDLLEGQDLLDVLRRRGHHHRQRGAAVARRRRGRVAAPSWAICGGSKRLPLPLEARVGKSRLPAARRAGRPAAARGGASRRAGQGHGQPAPEGQGQGHGQLPQGAAASRSRRRRRNGASAPPENQGDTRSEAR